MSNNYAPARTARPWFTLTAQAGRAPAAQHADPELEAGA